jgi:hypothetical protein
MISRCKCALRSRLFLLTQVEVVHTRTATAREERRAAAQEGRRAAALVRAPASAME